MEMKLLFWLCFLVMFLATSPAPPPPPDTSFSVDGGRTKAIAFTRKLIKESYQKGSIKLDDYHLVDPPPSSGVITSGPVEHGTPLIPHIPKPNNNATCPPSPSPFPSPTDNP